MKQILLTLLLFTCIHIAKADLMWTNWPNMDATRNCINIVDGKIQINIYVQIEESNMWNVDFQSNLGDTIVSFKSAVLDSNIGAYIYTLELPVGSFTELDYSFTLNLHNISFNAIESGIKDFCEVTEYALGPARFGNGGIVISKPISKIKKNLNYLVGNEFVDIGHQQDINIFPNPFNQNLTLQYSINEPQNVTIEIFDINGAMKHFKELKHDAGGIYEYNINDMGLLKGIYLCKIRSTNFANSIKIIKN